MSESEPMDLPWKPPRVEMKRFRPGVEPGQLDRAFDGVGAVVDEEGVAQLARRHHREQPGERRAPRLQQLLAVERHALHLAGHRVQDLGVVHPGAEDPVAAEAVDVLPAEQVLQHRAPRPDHSSAANWPASVTDFR